MQAWDNFVLKQEQVFGKKTTDSWLRSFRIITFDSCNLHLEAKDTFHQNWFEEHIRPKLKDFKNNNHRQIKVHIHIENEEEEKPKESTFEADLSPSTLDPSCTFTSFISCKENMVPFSLLKEEATKPIPSFNPIFIYGPESAGKTHLLMATANALLEMGKKVIYVSAAKFTKHVVNAIRSGFMEKFREKYRNIDCLIVDNIDVLGNKAATQEEFFHTFNTLHTEGKLIVLSAKFPPLQLQDIEERLISRFEWGIELKVEKPPVEYITKIIDLKEKAISLNLDTKTKEFLATCFSENLHGLQKALEAIAIRSHLSNEEKIDLQTAKRLISDLIEIADNRKITPDELVSTVAGYFELSKEDLFGKGQSKEIAVPRQISMYLLRERMMLPYSQIGKLFSKDHSTVMSSYQKIKKLLKEKNEHIAKSLFEIKTRLDRALT